MVKMSSRPNSRKLHHLFAFLVAFLILFVATITLLTWCSQYASDQAIRIHSKRPLKNILLWNSPHRIEAAVFGTGHKAFLNAKCPVSDCKIVANSTLFWKNMVHSNFKMLAKFDAVLFNIHELWLSSLPPQSYRRPQHQRYVLLTQESPQTMKKFHPENYSDFFNWTMSYRSDSDIQLPYGRIYAKQHILNTPDNNFYRRNLNKTKLVAWMVSHCKTPSKREGYVRELQKHIQVDIYGDCGSFQCAKNESHWLSQPECYLQLASTYKFYISFENSICSEYVTEKFFNILLHDMVPIVLGGANYTQIAPRNSYIDARQFDSPAKLATYLKLLDVDNDLYERYFDWKSEFIVETGIEKMARYAFCDLCAKLHRSIEEEPVSSYSSLVPQWSATSQCQLH